MIELRSSGDSATNASLSDSSKLALFEYLESLDLFPPDVTASNLDPETATPPASRSSGTAASSSDRCSTTRQTASSRSDYAKLNPSVARRLQTASLHAQDLNRQRPGGDRLTSCREFGTVRWSAGRADARCRTFRWQRRDSSALAHDRSAARRDLRIRVATAVRSVPVHGSHDGRLAIPASFHFGGEYLGIPGLLSR